MEKRFRRQAIAMCAVAAAMAASGADFPAPVNGTVTITAAGTYDGDFPSGTVSLAVNVAASETVVVGGDHPSFAGTVTVSGGTLKATSQYALGGEDATVSVESGARLWIAFAQPSGTGETSVLWKPKTIIAGSGISGGALKVCFSGSANCDRGVRWLELSDDATVDLSVDSNCKRWGANNLLPRGHTLTRANSGVDFVMRGTANGPGHYVNNAGTMLLQYLAFTSDCTTNNTSFTANSGTLNLWSNTQQTSVPGPIYLRGGAFGYSNSGTSVASPAWVSGAITFYSGNGITGSGTKKQSHFDGGLVNASSAGNFPVVCAGTNWIASLSSTGGKGFKFGKAKSHVTGPVAVQGNVQAVEEALVEFSGDNDRTMGGAVAAYIGLLEQTGGRTTAGMLRINNGGANYGVFRLAGGSFSTASDQPICGENQGGLGVFVLDGGDFICSNKFTFAKTAGGYGMAVQKGGSFTLRNSGLVAVGNAGDGRYYQLGGTHSARLSATDNANNIRTGLGREGGSGQVVVSGNGTIFETGALQAGNATVPSTNTLAIVNGGTLKVNRLFAAADSAAGTVSTLYVDGGEIWPGLNSGLSGTSTGASFTNANFTHAVLGEGGLAVDTSECIDSSSGGQGDCDFPHLFSAPTGRGIASITLPAAVAGLKYLGPAPIVIEGPGYGATAFADFDYATMSITTGVVLSAGCDYDSTTKVYVLGPSGNPQKYECTYELTSDGRAAGPFTKRGAGRLALYGQQGWGVATRVEGGTLRAVDSGSVPQGIGLAVESGATLELQYGDLSVSSLSGLGTITSSNADRGNVTLASGGTIGVVADDIVSGGKGPMTLAVGKLTLAGPATVVVADPEAILSHDRKITILTAADGIELASGASLQLDPACGLDGKWNAVISGQTIALSPVKAMTIIFR